MNNDCLGVNIVDVFIKNMIVWVGILEGLSCDNLPLPGVVVAHYGVGCHKMFQQRLWEIN